MIKIVYISLRDLCDLLFFEFQDLFEQGLFQTILLKAFSEIIREWSCTADRVAVHRVCKDELKGMEHLARNGLFKWLDIP